MSAAQRPTGIAGPSAHVHPGRPDAVNKSLTQHCRRRVVENDEYAAFTRRILRAYARRVAGGDIEAITCMAALADDIDAAVRSAITGLHRTGYSWAEIGARLGVTRQAAQQRWGTPSAGTGDAA